MSGEVRFPAFLLLWNRLQGLETPATHLRLAGWIERRWEGNDTRLLVMAFRAFGKSTIIGIFCTWALWRNPNLRILVLAADLALARKMVRQVKRIIEKHPLTRGLKPHRADQWGSECFTLRRTTELRDPSMLAKGIAANLTGSRADLIICDDVEVPKTCDTAGKRESLRDKLRELDYILTPEGTLVYAGTPHHWETIYADTPRGKEAAFLEGYRRIVIPIRNGDGASEWPERFSEARIAAMEDEAGPGKFASQMMCQPVNIADGFFNPDQLEIYDTDVDYAEAGGEAVLRIGERRMTAGAAWWDPAFGRTTGDKSVIAVVYTDSEGHYWLHHLQAILIKPLSAVPELEQQCRTVAALIEGYFVPVIGIETNGIGQFLPGSLKQTLSDCGVAAGIVPVANRRPKNIRIREGLEAVMAARKLHVHRTVLGNSFLRELTEWSPHKRDQNDDALDAVAGALSLQPVRIRRSFTPGKRAVWQGTSRVQKARTLMD